MPLHVSVVTPDREVWTGEANFVMATADGGDIGILPGHAPFLGALKHSIVKIDHTGEGLILMAVHGGFIEVFEDRVTLLGPTAELAEEIDIDRARRAREEAERAMFKGDIEGADAALLRAEARLRTVSEAGLIAG